MFHSKLKYIPKTNNNFILEENVTPLNLAI